MLQLNYNLKNKQFKLRMAWACELKVSWAVTTRPMGNVLTEFLWRWILFLPSSCPFFISPDFQQALSLFRMTKMNMSAFIANHCPAKMEFWKDVLPASLVITSNSFFLVCFMTSPFSVPQIISLCDWRFFFFLKTEFSSSVTINFINIRWRSLSALNTKKSILQRKEGDLRRKQGGENPTSLKEYPVMDLIIRNNKLFI